MDNVETQAPDANTQNPHERIAIARNCNCSICPISAEGKPQDYGVIASEFDISRPIDGIIVVGEIPSFNDKRGPLSGRAKKNWQEALVKSGLCDRNLLVIPAAHCVPSKVLKKTDRIKIATACTPSVKTELEAYPNVPVLLMGSDAITSFGIEKKINENRGFLHNTSTGRRYIITYAATTVMFGNIYSWGTFLEDLRRFNRLITNTLRPGLSPGLVTTFGGAGHYTDFMRRLRSNWFTVDIETTAPPEHPEWGLDPVRATLKTISFGAPDMAVSCSWTLADYATRKFIMDSLADSFYLKIFHNGPWFDLRVQQRFGLLVNNWGDTRDLRRAISSTSRLSLGFLGSLYCDIHAWKLDDDNEKKANSNDLAELLLYNGYDTIVTARVYEAMITQNLQSNLNVPPRPLP